MKLSDLQRYFAEAATSSSGPLPDLDRFFSGTGALPARDRLAIYNRGYFLRLLDALASVYEQTERVLGEAEFERLGLCYVAQHPSEHPAVERIGRAFPAFLRSVAAPALVVDLATLEWARLCALVAANPASVATVGAVDPKRFPEARLRFVPSLRWLELDPRALTAFNGAPPSLHDLRSPASTLPRCGIAVWRATHAVRHQSLDPTEWRALVSAARGATLSELCAAFDSGSTDADVRRAFRVLSGWFERHWLESVEYDPPRPASA